MRRWHLKTAGWVQVLENVQLAKRGAAGKSKDSDEDMQKKKNAGSEQEKRAERKEKETNHLCAAMTSCSKHAGVRRGNAASH